jgi:hypothetical protein
MQLGLRKIGQASAMVKVQVREDDVADVLRAVSEAGDLADGRLFRSSGTAVRIGNRRRTAGGRR